MASIKNKTVLLAAALLFLNLLSLNSANSSFLNKNTHRELQSNVEYSSNGIYYNLKYPKNDITGSGDKLGDVPYKVLCVIKACGACCVGEINNMQCGTAEDCKTYLDSTRVSSVVAAVIVPIGVTCIFILAYFIFKTKCKLAWDLSLLLAFTCMFVITIPFVIWYVMKKDTCCNKKDAKASG